MDDPHSPEDKDAYDWAAIFIFWCLMGMMVGYYWP